MGFVVLGRGVLSFWFLFFFSSRRRHTRWPRDWSSDVCSSDLPETSAGSLTVSGSSSNPTLVPNSGIVFGGSGSSRTVTVTPAANQTGTATISVTVSDGSLSTGTSFVLTVNPLTAIALTAPVNGANYTAPATIELAAGVT